jgi:hypothetical protein
VLLVIVVILMLYVATAEAVKKIYYHTLSSL